ncbi:MAG: lactoylglutathione lyase [Sphingomonas sp.]|uniref:VOC family protein n=1 Tax=Sphingomonas sp. TaxID=28214 RepID=UPI001B0CD45D|nr:VOC family protein [Sphingomonas sp.]MBO9621286.1 lactoylglutathione lyase [Sphingomonas sp.]
MSNAKMIFVNLPVADVARSTAFYEAIGCTKDERFCQADTASAMVWSDTITFMILSRDFFKSFTPKPIADAHQTTEVLLCLSRDSREEVDAIVEAAAAAGGKADVREKQDMGFMYGRSFEDPDGHIFEPMYMDVEAALAASGEEIQEEAA